ncbi:methyltransferase domain-containing protein [Novosphingobium sp. FSY-8]|uniref:Methyltransferase domain-containing protein n=2 Tax=Novosphingobium ovatum TaxID=1908523 RepID=A0ABW9XAM5_9SPHN|nr:methyltransferase domain-containing protein [Novosphingobium ovatum]
MDDVYRWQRHIYDVTRKYFLFGRDRMIAGLDLADGAHVLEIGCGTGRNLAQVGDIWPHARLYGFDISEQMLATAQGRLMARAHLAQGDACAFDPVALFGRAEFDRVFISYALSMIPDWQAALHAACAVLAPGGELHIVDFGDCAGVPQPLRAGLRAWLRHFHVTPRLDLSERAAGAVATRRFKIRTRRGPLGYYQLIVLKRRKKG